MEGEHGEEREGVVWCSLPTTSPPLQLPGPPQGVLALPSGPLVLTGGALYAMREGGAVAREVGGAVVAAAWDGEDVLVVRDGGGVCRVREEWEGVEGVEEVEAPPGITSLAATSQHCLAVGGGGALYTRGAAPYLGNTAPSHSFVRCH